MNHDELKDRFDYLTSLRFFTSDKYGIWRWDPLLVILGLILMAVGVGDPDFPGLWRLGMITLGAVMLIVGFVRIDRRLTKFKKDILKELERSK